MEASRQTSQSRKATVSKSRKTAKSKNSENSPTPSDQGVLEFPIDPSCRVAPITAGASPRKRVEVKGKYWCYTINNPTDEDLAPPESEFSYHVCGKEVGEVGTPHYQGYICMNDRRSLQTMKVMMPRAHLELARGTHKQASDYCKKGQQSSEEWKSHGILGPNYGKNADFFELGELPLERGVAGGQKVKRDWETAWDLAKAGDIESIDAAIRFPYYNAAKRIKQDYQRPAGSLDAVCGVWYVGPPNTGKSFMAREKFPALYDKACNKWWDGYQGEDVVLLDDFDVNHKVLGHHLKRWADRYSFPAEHKGTTTQIRPKKIIVTSNYHISEIFFEDPVLVAALQRRFVVEEFTEVYSNKE